jgi:hypothetical protein
LYSVHECFYSERANLDLLHAAAHVVIVIQLNN